MKCNCSVSIFLLLNDLSFKSNVVLISLATLKKKVANFLFQNENKETRYFIEQLHIDPLWTFNIASKEQTEEKTVSFAIFDEKKERRLFLRKGHFEKCKSHG